MILHDISVTTTPDLVTWESTDPGFECRWSERIGNGSVCNLSTLAGGAHVGTHIDAPLHYIDNGASLEQLNIDALVGSAAVIEIYGRECIEAADCENASLPTETKRILFKTDNSRRSLLSDPQFHADYVGLAPSAAHWLVKHNIALVGIDYLSIGLYGDANTEPHRILLGAGIVVLETLLLKHVQPGEYFLMALPPKYRGTEAGPCRVLLAEGITSSEGKA